MKKLIFLLLVAVLAASCGSGGGNTAKTKQVTLSAAGATFPQPFYNLAFKKYNEEGGPVINYGGIGFRRRYKEPARPGGRLRRHRCLSF